MNKQTVRIHNKDYETVASRVMRFRERFHESMAITTEIVSIDENCIVMKAQISNVHTDTVLATGYAEERRSSSPINKTSALENAETSAVGRALAFLGFIGDATEIASADEMAKDSISFEEVSALRDWITKSETDEKKFLDYYGITNIEGLTKKDYPNAIGMLKKKAGEKK